MGGRGGGTCLINASDEAFRGSVGLFFQVQCFPLNKVKVSEGGTVP